MKRESATVTSKGQLVIPAALRRETGIKAGTKIRFLQDELGRIVLQPVTEEFVDRLTGSLSGGNMLETWMEEHRAEGEHDK